MAGFRRDGHIYAICLLLLLSYSSIASTSLLLVKAITFTGVEQIYSYPSPNIEYFMAAIWFMFS